MELAVGTIISGKVTAITKFGAFVSLPGGKSGLVHISEVAAAFVSDVHDYLTEGQEVTVKILSVSPEGKINLSIKQAQPQQERPQPARSARPQGVSKHAQTAILICWRASSVFCGCRAAVSATISVFII